MSAEVSNTEEASGDADAKTNNEARLEGCIEIEDVKNRSKQTVPDGGWGWMVVFGSFMIYVIADGIKFSFGILVEDFVDYFECSKSAVGGVGSLMMAVSFCSGKYMIHGIPYDSDNVDNNFQFQSLNPRILDALRLPRRSGL